MIFRANVGSKKCAEQIQNKCNLNGEEGVESAMLKFSWHFEKIWNSMQHIPHHEEPCTFVINILISPRVAALFSGKGNGSIREKYTR